MTEPCSQRRYYAMALDPVHVGTGGYGIGRVDNSIVREPGTNLPKIPGSSISGVARAYSALSIQSKYPEKQTYSRVKDDKVESCAGKGGEKGEDHCGWPSCEVCVAFGFSKGGESDSSFQGLARFYDAQILFFPVPSMVGPVWVTSPSVLYSCLGVNIEVSPERFRKINAEHDSQLNFGWLMLQNDTLLKADVDLTALATCAVCEKVKGSAYIVPDMLFSRIVNDNLEVRTSVAIDPATGAAEDKALYSYEAIPRGTIMWFDVFYDNPQYFRIKGANIGVALDKIETAVHGGLELIELLGVGGMSTRGMGRMKVWKVEGGKK